MRRLPGWVQAVAVVAIIKILLGTAAIAIAIASGMPVPIGRGVLFLANVVAFAASGLLLLVGGRRDRRAVVLGVAFLLIAAVFADQLVMPFRRDTGVALDAIRAVMALQVDAFSPYLVWLFVREFPRIPDIGRLDRFASAVIRVSLATGIVLFAANALLFAFSLSPLGRPAYAFLGVFSRHDNGGLYWPSQYALLGLALLTLIWKARRAHKDERRRVYLLVSALAVGTAPTVLWVLILSIAPGVNETVPISAVGWVLYPTLLSTPFATAYAVVVRHALDVSLVIRRALQHALARYSVMTVAAIPLPLLLFSIIRNSDQTVAQLVLSPNGAVLSAIAIAGLVMLRLRGPLLERIDRRFFREQYDSRQILGQLVQRCGSAADLRQLSQVLVAEIDRALHLERVALVVLDQEGHTFASPDGTVRSLDATSGVADLLTRHAGVVKVDLEHPDSLFTRLPDDDLHWLVDGGFRLLLSLRDAGRAVIGVICLGEKKSELPFSDEDRLLLGSVASAAEMAIAYLNVRTARPVVDDRVAVAASGEACAVECPACSAVQPSGAQCARCGSATVECVLPHMIPGKFLIDARIGAGGMGIVYRGTDIELGRSVAIKTLPFLSPGEAMRLRREARFMASLSHPNLAMIFGAETWRGRPMLVFEFLAGGTLADRLANGPIEVAEAIDLGLALSAVLIAIHRAGVLHRDIKPSNIGFTVDRIPKLLDFGLAHILTTVAGGHGSAASVPERDTLASLSESAVDGTPMYMSPEAALGETPDASFDLWGLSLVLYEAMAGRHPLGFGGGARGRTIIGYTIPDLREHLPGAPAAVADFFRGALSRERAHRPRSATQLHRHLWRLRGGLDAAPGESTLVESTARVV